MIPFLGGLILGTMFGLAGALALVGLLLVSHRMAFQWLISALDDYLERIEEPCRPTPKKRALS